MPDQVMTGERICKMANNVTVIDATWVLKNKKTNPLKHGWTKGFSRSQKKPGKKFIELHSIFISSILFYRKKTIVLIHKSKKNVNKIL